MPDYFESGFFVEEPAWHRLGNVVKIGDVDNVEDAIRLAGLDWHVQECELSAFFTPKVRGQELAFSARDLDVPSHKALVRSTDQSVLGVVGRKYTPLQNDKAFAFFNPFLRSGLCRLESAGSLKGGSRVWILARVVDAEANVLPGDRVVSYLLLSNSHDGSTSVRVQFTVIRVVCWNTLETAETRGDSGKEERLFVRHTARVEIGLDEVQKMVDLAQRTFRCSVKNFQRLAAGKLVGIDGLRNYVSEVLQAPLDDESNRKGVRAYAAISSSYQDGPGAQIPGVHGTYWGAFNAVTDWIDHTRGRTDESRLDASWFGSGAVLRSRALRVALEHCPVH